MLFITAFTKCAKRRIIGMEDKRDILKEKSQLLCQKYGNLGQTPVIMKAKFWVFIDNDKDVMAQEFFSIGRSPYLVVICHGSVCSGVSQLQLNLSRIVPRVFGKVFSNNCGRSRSLSRDFISSSWTNLRLQTSREAGYLIIFPFFFFFSHIFKDRNFQHY